MQRFFIFLMLLIVTKVSGQTTGYLRFDTVKIMKQNGSSELYVINKTKDSLGLLTNVGGGLTQFKRSRALTDSTIIIGNDTVKIIGGTLVRNGLTKNGSYAELGGTLIKNTTITGVDSGLILSNGTLTVNVDHQVNGAVPPFRVISTSVGFHEMGEFRSDGIVELWLRSNNINSYSGIAFALGGTHYLGIGTDGNADHNYIQTHAGFPIYIENNASSVMSAFEDDGDISMVVNGTGRRFGVGVIAPVYRMDVNGAKTALTASDRVFNLNDAGTTYNTTSGALTNNLAYLNSTASRSSGANDLTNQALYLRAAGGQVNHGLFIDTPSTFVHGLYNNTGAWANIVHLQTIANTSSTQKFNEVDITRSMVYTDTAAGSEGNNAGALVINQNYRFKQTGTIPDNLSGNAARAVLNFRRNAGYVGVTTVQGAIAPTNNVTTMPSVSTARLDLSQLQAGSNSIRLQGYWAAFTPWIALSSGNSIGKFAWINTGAAQSGGAIDTGYAVYINTLPPAVTMKYAVYQEGAADSNYLAGITKVFNLQSDKTVTAGGTTGNQTINKISGTVNFAAGATSLTVTNSFVTANSLVIPFIRTVDATAKNAVVVCSSGSFVITLNASATAETSVGFLVIN